MVRQFLLIAGVTAALTAFAAGHDSSGASAMTDFGKVETPSLLEIKQSAQKMSLNDGSNSSSMMKAPNLNVHWRRPAGQFWGVGYSIEDNTLGYYFTPLVLRPWIDYTFENLTVNASGNPSWSISNWSNEAQDYQVSTSNEVNANASYLRYETTSPPRLVYSKLGVPYPTQFYKDKPTESPYNEMYMTANYNIADAFGGNHMPVSSHYWGIFTRHAVERSGLLYYTGAKGYDNMEDPEQGGCWFGTNARGINAMATRFEKPLQPYLLNSIHWFYYFFQDVPEDIPMKAYVFKTLDDAAIQTGTNSKGEEYSVEVAELGELIAVSESFVPAAVFDEENNYQNAVKFEFKEVNPVTGAETAVSLEIDDDIIVVVTGFNADLGNGGYISTLISTDEFDEGYGNLGFLGNFDEDEEGNISYDLTAISNFFSSPLANTVLGVFADVSYPWLYGFDQPSDVHVGNEGETTEDYEGLQYVLGLYATSMTEEWDVTFDGEEECDWLQITGVYDEMDEDDPEEYAGFSAIQLEASPNPDDISRTCVVKISIPAASYTLTVRQGSQNPSLGVEVVEADSNVQYFDLAGRRVANPDKGIYIKKNGNKTEKIVF